MNSGIRIPNPVDVLYGHGVSLSCSRDGQLFADKLHGLFAGDTRVLSTYRIAIGGFPWKLLGRSRTGPSDAEWHFQNPAVREPAAEIPAGTILLTLKRSLAGALHDDLRLCSFSDGPVQVRLILRLDADFADIFEVKQQTLPPRLNVLRIPDHDQLTLRYDRRGFHRGLRIRFRSSGRSPVYIGTQIIFELDLKPRSEWTCCLEASPLINTEVIGYAGDPHRPEDRASGTSVDGPLIRSAQLLEAPFRRGQSDLRSLTISQQGSSPHIAAGVPWFFTLFGRDQIIAALMAGLDGAWSARGALQSLTPWQARERDDWRDAEPGKLPHELRRGELAARGLIPHTPYYGTHDAPALYCLLLWQAWQWTGDKGLLDSYLEPARNALAWCEKWGDRDGDGFQEYETRSRRGYYNQGWKDSEDAIVHADGRKAQTPLATVELQGYLFTAYRAMAELLLVKGDLSRSERLKKKARDLRSRVEESFWMEDQRFYAQALDRHKKPVASISSNPGHILWCGLPTPERAKLLAERFLQQDLFSGWGIRTLSARNPAYNPLSYQRGSVWPFDTALAAAGMLRYGLREEAGKVLRSVLDAAIKFEEERLPELFCGVDRSAGGPVPYEEANIPQAWSAAVPILAAQLFLGIFPDAPRGRCFLSPWLPEWLPELELNKVKVGQGEIDVRVARRGDETVIDHLEAKGIEVTRGVPEAPLWGKPEEM